MNPFFLSLVKEFLATFWKFGIIGKSRYGGSYSFIYFVEGSNLVISEAS